MQGGQVGLLSLQQRGGVRAKPPCSQLQLLPRPGPSLLSPESTSSGPHSMFLPSVRQTLRVGTQGRAAQGRQWMEVFRHVWGLSGETSVGNYPWRYRSQVAGLAFSN